MELGGVLDCFFCSNSGEHANSCFVDRRVTVTYRQTSTGLRRCGIEVYAYLFVGKLLQPRYQLR